MCLCDVSTVCRAPQGRKETQGLPKSSTTMATSRRRCRSDQPCLWHHVPPILGTEGTYKDVMCFLVVRVSQHEQRHLLVRAGAFTQI